MPIYEFAQTAIRRLEATAFSEVGLHERRDLQRLLREHVEVIAPETLVISEEFGDWEDSRRRIDLLAIDKAANLVVIELKRTEDGGHMELQSIRYAAMVSTMTFERAADAFGQYLKQHGKEDQDPRAKILDFLGWDEPDHEQFAQDVRIVLASAEFSKELTSSVLWLNERDIDIRCVRLKPYNLDGRVLVDVQQIIPLPEAADYQTLFREKARKEREARSNADFTRFDIQVGGETHPTMWKRNAIFVVCKHLCEHGIDPDEITTLLEGCKHRVWFSMDGTLNASEFERLASERSSIGGSTFDNRRWFCGDAELVHADGKTYAFSNQWGGQMWHTAMQLLKERYSSFKIEYSPVRGIG
ncbi:MAG: hypothetical protein Q8P46_05360 [Hyphomicrobiales bacterium]|nr:hypothetical protein [Hyphomicrobiales bacterium]